MRKHSGLEFSVKQGGLGAFNSKKSAAIFFAPLVARTALGVGFRTSFVDRTETTKTHQTRVLGQKGWIG